LSVEGRFGSNTDWFWAGVANSVVRHMIIKGLIEREEGADSYVLTDQGREVLAALLGEH
jgi:predicted transcriptional regulator